jgi:hypothetical protein
MSGVGCQMYQCINVGCRIWLRFFPVRTSHIFVSVASLPHVLRGFEGTGCHRVVDGRRRTLTKPLPTTAS